MLTVYDYYCVFRWQTYFALYGKVRGTELSLGLRLGRYSRIVDTEVHRYVSIRL